MEPIRSVTAGPDPISRSLKDSASPAVQQLAVGLQAAGVRSPVDSVDISEQARRADEERLAARQAETSVQPVPATPPAQDDEKRRRVPFSPPPAGQSAPDHLDLSV